MSEHKEIASLRHSDGIDYLFYKDFKIEFPLHNKIGVGSYGNVYESGTKYAVKVFDVDPTYRDLITELNMYACILHPCIIKPLAWTTHQSRGYIAMKKGEKIRTAFTEGKITIEEIISDTLSAIAFLNSQGIAHCDIKPGNIIFHKGKAKLIDMGLARYTELNTDGQYYIKGEAYTPEFKDLEYVARQYNNIKCEITALALTYISLLINKIPEYGFNYESKIPHLDYLFTEAKKLVVDRPDIQSLIDNAPQELIVRHYTGIIFKEPDPEYDPTCGNRLYVLMSWLIEIAYERDIKAKALFLCLHLIQRIYTKIDFVYHSNGFSFQLFGCVAMNLALIVTSSDRSFSIELWKRVMKSTDINFEVKYEAMVITVVALAHGIISTLTYWDYAQSNEDLLALLKDCIQCNYNPSLIQKTHKGTNKCITVRQFMTKDDLQTLDQPHESSTKETPTDVHPCKLNTDSDIREVIYLFRQGAWTSRKYIYTLPVILHNRDVLYKLNINQAIDIFIILRQFIYPETISTFILDVVCHFDWRTKSEKFLSLHAHPFTDQDF